MVMLGLLNAHNHIHARVYACTLTITLIFICMGINLVAKSGLEICSILISIGYQILKLDTEHHKLSIHWDAKQMSVLHRYMQYFSVVHESL